MFEFLKSFYGLCHLLIYSLNKYLWSANWPRHYSICYCPIVMNKTDKNPCSPGLCILVEWGNKNSLKSYMGLSARDTCKAKRESRRAMVRGWDEILSNLARYRLTEKVTYEWALEEEKGVNHVGIWETRVPGRGNGNYKGPGAGMYLVYLKVEESMWLEE